MTPATPDKRCPNCGATVPERDRVCPECRYDFELGHAPSDPRDPHGEPLNPGG